VGVEPLFESRCLVLVQRHTASRPGDVAASDGEMDDDFALASRLDIGHAVDVDVRAIAYLYDGHDRLRIRVLKAGARGPLFSFFLLRVPCVLGGSIIVRMG